MAARFLAPALALALLTSACSQAISGTPPAGIPDKVASAVTRAVAELEAGQPLDPRQARSDAEGRLQVYVHVTVVSSENVQALAESGLRNAVPSPTMGLVQGWITPRDIAALAALAIVTRITLPQYADHY